MDDKEIMSMMDKPLFPPFKPNTNSSLGPHSSSKTYEYLLISWDMQKCFMYYYEQSELWSSASSEHEYNSEFDKEMKMSAKEPKSSEINDKGEEEEIVSENWREVEELVQNLGELEEVLESENESAVKAVQAGSEIETNKIVSPTYTIPRKWSSTSSKKEKRPKKEEV